MQTMTRSAKISTMEEDFKELCKKLDGLFSRHLGSRKAFCEKESISREGLKLLLMGKVRNDERLYRAAAFIEQWPDSVAQEQEALKKRVVDKMREVIGNMASDGAPELN